MLNRFFDWLGLSQRLAVGCFVCRSDTTLSQPICPLCIDAMPCVLRPCCCCGLPIATGEVTENINICASCLQQRPPFDACYAPYLYAFPIDCLVQRVKHHKQWFYLPPLAREMARHLQLCYQDGGWPDAVLPVPLHNRRLRYRGFDQALVLARLLLASLKTVCSAELKYDLIKRHKHTASQQELGFKKRRSNIRGAFSINGSSDGSRHMAIIDDVVTTTATVSEITHLLKRNGVERVDIWCLARTPDKSG